MPSFQIPQAISNLFWSKEPRTPAQLALTPEQLNQHANELAKFFPLLFYSKQDSQIKAIDELKRDYLQCVDLTVGDLEVSDKIALKELIFDDLQQHNRNYLKYINLDDFNQTQARRLAEVILGAYNTPNSQTLEILFDDYQSALFNHLLEQLPLINQKKWTYRPPNSEKIDSLAFLWNNELMRNTNEFLSKMGDAHAFIQATGLSPQYENSILSFLDIYNYKRSYKEISEIKSIAFSLFKPFHAIYFEYKDIAFYENNALKKLLRVLMPLVIIVACIILTAILLNPFTLPELAFAAAFIPAFVFGIVLSNQYIWLKNNTYNSVREFLYGGRFEIPEFKINERMIKTFHTPEKATWVREFYIRELKQCESLEMEYQKKESWLNSDEQTSRKDNLQRRETLCLEWYDIHSSKMAIDKVPEMVRTQIEKSTLKETHQLQAELDKVKNDIKDSVTQLVDIIKDNLFRSKPYEEEEAKKIPMTFQIKLFKPKECLYHKHKAEEMDNFANSL